MSHKDIFKIFTTWFPHFLGNNYSWFPNGKGSIRVRLDLTNENYVFSFKDKSNWCLETVDHYLKRMKGDK